MYKKTYNGMSSFETWVTALWLDNDTSASTFWNAEAWDCWKAAPTSDHFLEQGFDREEAAVLDLAWRMRQAIHEQCPDLGACVYADLLRRALAGVNWFEVASPYFEDMTREADGRNDNE